MWETIDFDHLKRRFFLITYPFQAAGELAGELAGVLRK